MKKLIGILVFGALLLSSAQAQLFTHGQAEAFAVRAVASDDLGFVYSVGQNSLGQGVVNKYSPNNTLVWTFADGAGGTNGTDFKFVRVAPNGDIVVGGSFGTSAVFGGSTITTSGSTDPMIAMIDAQGVLQWYQQFPGGSSSFENMFDVHFQPNGDVTCLGVFYNSILINGSAQSMTGAGPFFATYSATGAFVSGGIGSVSTGSIWQGAFDAAGNMYVTSFDNPDQTLSKFDPSGLLQWQLSGTGYGEWWDLAIDNQGNVIAGGSFDGTFNMNGNTYTSSTMWDDLFIFKASPTGQFLWAKQFSSNNTDNIYDIEVNAAGEVFLSGNVTGACVFDLLTTPHYGSIDVFLAKLDAAGNVMWATTGGSGSVDLGTGLDVNRNTGKITLASACSGTPVYGPITVNTTNSLWLEVLDHANTTRGILFRDWDGNGVQGVGEGGFANRSIMMTPGPLYGFSGVLGNYEIYSDIGNYAISLPSVPLYHSLSGASSHTASFASLGQFDLGNDFALLPTPNMNDLKVQVVAWNYGARQGRTEGYHIYYENVGTTTIPSATVTFRYPAGSNFNYATPAPSNIISASDSVEWNVGSLAPGQTGYIFATVVMPTFYPLASLIDFHAHILPVAGDQTPGDNHSHMLQTVVGPYDPNIKQVYPAGDISPQFVAGSEYLEYTVHFQNTGNDTAYFVRLEDTISANLDLSTFEFMAGSHGNIWHINNDRKLTIDFEHIMLPDSFVDEPRSHGYFKYRVKPLSSLQLGAEIHNRANIFFDYNAAIVTNTTVTVVAEPVSVQDEQTGGFALKAFPNPVKDHLQLSVQGNASGSKVLVTVYDLQGRVMAELAPFSAGTQLDMGGFPAGMYLLRATDLRGKLLGSVKVVLNPS